MTELFATARGWILILLACFVLLDGCKSAEDRFLNYSPKGDGPIVESAPARLKSCSPKPRPTAALVPTPGAPIELRLVRAYHLCLGSHVALLRLARAQKTVVQVVLEYETYDVLGRRPPRRTSLTVTKGFTKKTVRYQRIEWREGRVHTDERGFRVRLAAVDFANKKRWTAPPWPPSPAVVPPAKAVPGPLAPVDKLQKSLMDATRKIHERGQKLIQGSAKHPGKPER